MSTGGNAGAFFVAGGGMPSLTMNTGATAGNIAQLDLGGEPFSAPVRHPLLSLGQVTPAPSGDLSIQIGFASDIAVDEPPARAELIYDPNNHLSGPHGATDWYFEVEPGGTFNTSTDLPLSV